MWLRRKEKKKEKIKIFDSYYFINNLASKMVTFFQPSECDVGASLSL